MTFRVKFMDGDKIWLPYRKDLHESVPFQTFVKSRAALTPLCYDEKGWRQRARGLNAQEILLVRPKSSCFVDLRAWGAGWYKSLGLPDTDQLDYVVLCSYLCWENKARTRIQVSCPIFKQKFVWKNTDVMCFGSVSSMAEGMVLVDEVFCDTHPAVLRAN
jgi:hypothetical protein